MEWRREIDQIILKLIGLPERSRERRDRRARFAIGAGGDGAAEHRALERVSGTLPVIFAKQSLFSHVVQRDVRLADVDRLAKAGRAGDAREQPELIAINRRGKIELVP